MGRILKLPPTVSSALAGAIRSNFANTSGERKIAQLKFEPLWNLGLSVSCLSGAIKSVVMDSGTRRAPSCRAAS
jgi:hypothetical protein